MPTHTTAPPLLRRVLALGATTGLLAGLCLAGPLPAQAEVAETDVTELALAAPAATTSSKESSQQRSSQRRDGGTGTTAEEAVGTVLAELPQQEVAEFSTLGVTWSTASSGPAPTVEYRTRTDGAWTDWSSAPTAEQEPADQQRTGTDPVYVGESDGVQVRLTGSSATQLQEPRIALVAPETSSQDAQLQTTAAAAAAPGLAPRPAYVSRAGWGADESMKQCSTDTGDTIQAAIVHHTAGVNSYTRAESASIVRGIYAYHTKTLGWCDIGYNFLVDKYGQVFEGRSGGVDKPVHGAHATSWNTNTVGISFMGNYETAAAPAVMLEAGAQLLAWKFDAYYRDPLSKVTLAGKYIDRISGHGDVMATACPGRNVRSKMAWLRERVDVLVGDRRTPIFQRWQALGGDGGTLGSPYVGEAVVAGGRRTVFAAHDVYASDATGAYWLTGGIRDRYRSLDGPAGRLGFPTTDEEAWPAADTASNRFQMGAIIWTSRHSSHMISDGFWNRYRDDADLRTRLGAPASDEYSHQTLKVSVQDHDRGRTFWSGGHQVVTDGFYNHLRRLDLAQQAERGVPTGREAASSRPGVSVQTFSKATFYWVGGVRETYGGINDTYVGLGREKSRLGLPLGTEQDGPNGSRVSEFEGGTITWAPGKGTTVRYG